ncbi:rhomboid family intramembrane serine protease [Haloechinothrix salitolerans]
MREGTQVPHDRDIGSLRSPLGKSATTMLLVLVVLWAVDVANALGDRRWNFEFGIVGRDPEHLLGIVTAPLLHANAEHLVANGSALFTLGLIAGLYGIWRFLGVVLVVVLLGGFVAWVFAPQGTVSVGASGIVFGLLGYLVARGLVERRPVDIVISLGVGVAFGYHIFSGVVPTEARVAWWAHLTGFLAGIVAAWIFRRRRKTAAADAAASPDAESPAASSALPVRPETDTGSAEESPPGADTR